MRGGEFEVKVKISGEYKVRFDQAGLMLRIDAENYIKTGIEYFQIKHLPDARRVEWLKKNQE